ncbi:MAG: hypothetical protein RMJ53_08565 [Chitinophagales bacterium]|nr:hypothetical protein [Chitinophagales bacterium]MDW8274263.1 hypothetical protein [Chitinophagales bacterium]
MKLNYVIVVFVSVLFTLAACKRETDKTSIFEGTYFAPSAYSFYDNVIVKRVDNNSFSLQYVLGKSAPYLIVPQAFLKDDSVFTFDVQASVGGSTDKYLVKGEGKIFPNRIVITGKATNTTNPYDFYLIPFEGYRK